jgi:hypothetical protein
MHKLALVILANATKALNKTFFTFLFSLTLNATQIGSTDLYSILFEHEDVLFHYLSVPSVIDLAQKTMQQIVCKGV